MSKDHMSFKSGGLSEMREYYDIEIHEEITKTKVQIVEIVHAFADRVKANVPVGPPKRKRGTPFYEGMLRDSVERSASDYGDEIHAQVSVGDERTESYLYILQHELAKEGKDFFRGADDAEDAIDRAMNGQE